MTSFPNPEIPIYYWDILTFLAHTGWLLVDNPNSRFVVFNGPKDIDNRPIEIVFLRNPDAREQSLYISNALEILSNLNDQDPSQIVRDISVFNRDSLRIRILGVEVGDGIPLRTAALHISELKQLVAYAARSEVDQKPFYLNAQHPDAKNLVDAFRFGHTFKGSFGFTIETPRFLEIQKITQLSLLPELVSSKIFIPQWRRIMERIARGLSSIQEATQTKNPTPLIRGYKVGFNANMCQTLANMLADDRFTIEYSVKWSALKLPDDPLIQSLEPVKLDKISSNHLEYAANELIELQPEENITVSGLIIELSAKDSPLALDTSRTIRIRWNENSEGKTYEATATLSREDYFLAIKAHENWSSVQITGTLLRKKRHWLFVNYSDFRVTDWKSSI